MTVSEMARMAVFILATEEVMVIVSVVRARIACLTRTKLSDIVTV